MKFLRLNESLNQITFESLDDYKDKVFYLARRPDVFYDLMGKFVGYDGVQYVALIKRGAFADKSYLKFDSFVKTYNIKED